MNADRKVCHYFARQQRVQGREINPFCGLHDPPCLLQNAALTGFECFNIQINLWRQAYGLPLPPQPPRPDFHNYATLEDRLPVATFGISQTLTLDPKHDLITPQPPEERQPASRPRFYCRFCKLTRSHKGPVYIWRHLRQVHSGDVASNASYIIDDQTLLKESRIVAKQWHQYLRLSGYGSKTGRVRKLISVLESPKCTWRSFCIMLATPVNNSGVPSASAENPALDVPQSSGLT